ncbi:MAG: cobalamin-binding protein [Actinobacteria bacterium]|nr:cobalamin-binding protein [Actinomycetota bacterium]
MRVVSLVPSATESLLALGVEPVACTRFCDQPGIPTIGGTKDPDLAAVVALGPDLVVVNDEENRREDASALETAGLALHSMSLRSVHAVGAEVCALADRAGAPEPERFVASAWAALLAAWSRPAAGRAVVCVWRRPWMLASPDTYGASVLALLGWEVVVPAGTRRYPEVTLGAIGALDPDLVVLPSEPYRFGARHVAEAHDRVPGARVTRVDGRDLFWWGTRTPDAIARLAAML